MYTGVTLIRSLVVSNEWRILNRKDFSNETYDQNDVIEAKVVIEFVLCR